MPEREPADVQGMAVEASQPVRVLVVDDSAFMRRAIAGMLGSDPGIQVVDTARNGRIGIEKIKQLKPDVVTMDIEMPELDGISALKIIMSECPTNVIIISSLTQAGSKAAMEALAAGAVDVMAKDHSTVSDTIHELRDDLVARVKSVARRDPTRRLPRLRRLGAAGQASKPSLHDSAAHPERSLAGGVDPEMTIGGTIELAGNRFRAPCVDLICIGSSTGGPSVVEEIVRAIPAELRVPVVVAQHMPFMFTQSMAERLNGVARVPVVHAADRMPIDRGRVYIAPGGKHLQLVRRGGTLQASVCEAVEGYLYKPSVDLLFLSAASLEHTSTLGVVLTGMGCDGADGAKRIAEAGGTIIAQDKDTCVVWGMPRAVAEGGCAAALLPPSAIAAAVAQSAIGGKAAA